MLQRKVVQRVIQALYVPLAQYSRLSLAGNRSHACTFSWLERGQDWVEGTRTKVLAAPVAAGEPTEPRRASRQAEGHPPERMQGGLRSGVGHSSGNVGIHAPIWIPYPTILALSTHSLPEFQFPPFSSLAPPTCKLTFRLLIYASLPSQLSISNPKSWLDRITVF